MKMSSKFYSSQSNLNQQKLHHNHHELHQHGSHLHVPTIQSSSTSGPLQMHQQNTNHHHYRAKYQNYPSQLPSQQALTLPLSSSSKHFHYNHANVKQISVNQILNNKQQRASNVHSMMLTVDAIDSIQQQNNLICHHSNTGFEEPNQDGLGPLIDNEKELDDEEKHSEKYLERCALFNSSWTFSEDYIINKTPSRKHGMSFDEEMDQRRKGTSFIRDLAKFLKTKPICKETAYVYFHRFFMLRSFKEHEPKRIAMACLFLAGKYEDQPHCKDHIIQVSYMLNNNYSFSKQTSQNTLNKNDKEYNEYCERLINDENHLLQVLGFKLRVSHPQALIVETFFQTKNSSANNSLSMDVYKDAYQVASEMNRLTMACLVYNARILASVSIYLAACYKSITLPDNWFNSIIANSNETVNPSKLINKIGQQYRETLASSSQLIRKMLSSDYIRMYGTTNSNNKINQNNKSTVADSQKHSNLLLLNNFSPDSAYSSSSSNAAAYSPAETAFNGSIIVPTTNSNNTGDNNDRLNTTNNRIFQDNIGVAINKLIPTSMLDLASHQQFQQQQYSSSSSKHNINKRSIATTLNQYDGQSDAAFVDNLSDNQFNNNLLLFNNNSNQTTTNSQQQLSLIHTANQYNKKIKSHHENNSDTIHYLTEQPQQLYEQQRNNASNHNITIYRNKN